jgi:RNA polymerase sigma-70 factor (ECF subfamily)
VTADLIDLARAGDGEAFRQLVGPYERELQVHCYRMLGSVRDAEDAMQDALLAAWQGIAGFEGRASVRTWLYRVTTSRCLNVRRSARRRQGTMPPGPPPPEPTRLGEVTWLEPCPDDLLEGLPAAEPGPEASYEAREAISLAFITAVQRLPPRQRAVLILRDVLGFAGREAARILGSTEESVTSALKRARATLRTQLPEPAAPPPAPESAREKQLVERLTRAYESGDVDGIIALFADDAWLTMPPAPLEYQGHGPIARFLTEIAFRDGRTYRLVPTRANGQLAVAAYLREPAKPEDARANGLHVLALSGDRIQAMTRFTSSVLPRFGLPPG